MLNALASQFFGKGSNTVSDQVSDQVAQEDRQRLNEFALYWKAFDGKLDKPLKATKTDPHGKDNQRFNYSALIVEIGVSFLFGVEPDFKCDGTAEGSDEEWLDKCLKQNKIMQTLMKLGINGGVCGQVFLKVMPPLPPVKPYPRIVVLDPANVYPVIDPEDCDNVLSWRIQWNAIDPKTGKPMVRRQLIEPEGGQWLITDQVSKQDSPVFVNMSAPVLWPFMWSPISYCQNMPIPNSFWGRSDLELVVEINDAINFSASNSQRIERVHGHPKTVGAGFRSTSLTVNPDEVIILPNPEATLKNLEMQSDLSAAATWYQIRMDALHEITRVPECATGKVDNLGSLSGVAIQTLFQPLIQKTKAKQVLYGPMLEEVCCHLLELGGKGEHTVDITWPAVLPKNDYEEAQTATLESQIGVSARTLIEQMGYDYDVEAKNKAEEDEAAAQAGADMMKKFGTGTLPGQDPTGQSNNGNGNNGGKS